MIRWLKIEKYMYKIKLGMCISQASKQARRSSRISISTSMPVLVWKWFCFVIIKTKSDGMLWSIRQLNSKFYSFALLIFISILVIYFLPLSIFSWLPYLPFRLNYILNPRIWMQLLPHIIFLKFFNIIHILLFHFNFIQLLKNLLN